MQKLQQQPTIEQVLKFLKDNRAKSFVLDIETDSTIVADENAEKQRRTEFVQMLGGLMQQLGQMVAADPANAKFCGEVLKFSVAPFRAGRQLDGAIDEMVERMETKGSQGKGDDPTDGDGQDPAADRADEAADRAAEDRAGHADCAGQTAAGRPAQADGVGEPAPDCADEDVGRQPGRARSTWRCRARRCRKAARRTRRNWRPTSRRWKSSGRRRRCRRKAHMMKAQSAQQAAALKAQQPRPGPI